MDDRRRERRRPEPIPRLDPEHLQPQQITAYAQAIHDAQQRVNDKHPNTLSVVPVADLEEMIASGEMYALGTPDAVEVSFYLTRLGDVPASIIPGAADDDERRVDVRRAGGFFATNPMKTLGRCLESYGFADRPDDIILIRTADSLGRQLTRRRGYTQVPIPTLREEHPELFECYFGSRDDIDEERSMYIRLPLEDVSKQQDL